MKSDVGCQEGLVVPNPRRYVIGGQDVFAVKVILMGARFLFNTFHGGFRVSGMCGNVKYFNQRCRMLQTSLARRPLLTL